MSHDNKFWDMPRTMYLSFMRNVSEDCDAYSEAPRRSKKYRHYYITDEDFENSMYLSEQLSEVTPLRAHEFARRFKCRVIKTTIKLKRPTCIDYK